MTKTLPNYLEAIIEVLRRTRSEAGTERAFDVIADRIRDTRTGSGRLFVAAVGGMLEPAAYLVSELERHARINAISVGNIHPATLSSLCNDVGGWDNAYKQALKLHEFNPKDILLVFSVGGGQPGISNVISNAVLHAKEQGGFVAAIVGKKNGVAHSKADVSIVIPAQAVDANAVSSLAQDSVRIICSALTHKLQLTSRTFDSSPAKSAP